jgi:hypothetical protein
MPLSARSWRTTTMTLWKSHHISARHEIVELFLKANDLKTAQILLHSVRGDPRRRVEREFGVARLRGRLLRATGADMQAE